MGHYIYLYSNTSPQVGISHLCTKLVTNATYMRTSERLGENEDLKKKKKLLLFVDEFTSHEN